MKDIVLTYSQSVLFSGAALLRDIITPEDSMSMSQEHSPPPLWQECSSTDGPAFISDLEVLAAPVSAWRLLSPDRQSRSHTHYSEYDLTRDVWY